MSCPSTAYQRNPWVEGVPLYVYGHSIIMYPGIYNTPYSGEMAERVRSRLNMGRGYFMARSGTYLMDNVALMLSAGTLAQPTGQSGDRQWQPGRRGIVLHQNYGNEIVTSRGNDPLYINQWKHSLRTAFALFGSASVVSVADATRSPGWTLQVGGANWFWNDTDYASSTIGATCDYPIPYGDEAWVLTANSTNTYLTGQQQIQCNGTTLRTIDTCGTMAPHASALPGNPTRQYLPTAYKVTGLNDAAGTDGPKTLRVRVNEDRTVFTSAVLIPNPHPPRVFYGLDYIRQGNSPGAALSSQQEPAYRAAALEVIAEFPYVTAVDMNDGWDGATMVSTLDLGNAHPNDLGMIHHANKYVEAINATITGPDRGVMTL